MALTLSALTISKRTRTRTREYSDARSYAIVKFYVDISWTNTSDESHWIEATITGDQDGPTALPVVATSEKITKVSSVRGSTSMARVLLTTWRAKPSALDLTRDIDIEIIATNGTISSTPITTTVTVTLADTTTLTLPYFDTASGDLVLPAPQTSGTSVAQMEVENLPVWYYNTTARLNYKIGEDNNFKEIGWVRFVARNSIALTGLAGKSEVLVTGIPAGTTRLPSSWLASAFAKDGSFWEVTFGWVVPKTLTTAQVKEYAGVYYWDNAKGIVNEEKTFTTMMEFWKSTKTAPVISSSLFATATVGGKWTYNIRATGATSFASNLIGLIAGATEESVNTETGEISAIFDATTLGDNIITITATNEVGSTVKNLTITVVDFAANDAAFSFAINKYGYGILTATTPDVTWAYTSGDLPPGMQVSFGVQVTPDVRISDYIIRGERLDAWAIQGTPTLKGSYTFVVTATKAGTLGTDTATITVSVTSTGGTVGGEDGRTVIISPSNASSYVSNEVMLTRERLRIGLLSDPPVALWSATGLPPGITIDATTGLIDGILTTPGRYSALITAKAEGLLTSLPLLLVASVDVNPSPPTLTETGGDGSLAIARLPWLADEWIYTDIQIHARSRRIESTLLGEGGLRLKAGDDINFLIFFIGADNLPFDIVPTSLKITIREANNLDDPLVFEAAQSLEVVAALDDACYLITSAKDGTGRSDMRDIVEGWVANATKKDAKADSLTLPCVCDVEWEVGGQLYSSDPLPVLIELDVTR